MQHDFNVRLHAWTRGSPAVPLSKDGEVDVTPYLEAVNWTESVNAPWGGVSVQLAIPYRRINMVIPGRITQDEEESENGAQSMLSPETGFWITIRHGGRAYGLYRCHRLSFGVANGGAGLSETTPVMLEGENFLSFLGKSRLQLAPALTPNGAPPWGLEGFVYNLETWSTALTQILGGVLQKPLGELLAELWKTIVKVSLPPSLCRETSEDAIGSTVPIVFDANTAGMWTPIRKGQCEQVPGTHISPAIAPTDSMTLLSYFMSMFAGDPRAVEFFPVIDILPPDSQPSAFTPLANKLGQAQPVLIYRMRPWILQPLTQENVQNYTGGQVSEQTAATKAGLAQTAMTTKPPGDCGWYEFPASTFENLSPTWDDGDRVNGVWGASFASDTGSGTYGVTGQPLVRSEEQVQRHGFRVSEMRWPFFPQELQHLSGVVQAANASAALTGQVAGTTAVTEAVARSPRNASLIDHNNAVTELLYAYAGESERFCRGSVKVQYRPQVKPGHWARFYLQNMGNAVLTAYIETVTHYVQVNGNIITSSTVIQYMRGTLRRGTLPAYQSPMLTAQVSVASNKGPAPFVFQDGFLQAATAVAAGSVQGTGSLVSRYGGTPIKGGDTQLTPHYKASYFRCKDVNNSMPPLEYVPSLKKLCSQLEIAALPFGVERFRIQSGYRTEEYNAAIGGANRSAHKFGLASDINFFPEDQKKYSLLSLYGHMESLIQQGVIHNGGMSWYPNHGTSSFIHYDVWWARRIGSPYKIKNPDTGKMEIQYCKDLSGKYVLLQRPIANRPNLKPGDKIPVYISAG